MTKLAGIDAYFEQFQLSSEPFLSHLAPPNFTPELIQAMREGCRAMAAGRDKAALAAARDQMVIETLLAQRRAGFRGTGSEGMRAKMAFAPEPVVSFGLTGCSRAGVAKGLSVRACSLSPINRKVLNNHPSTSGG